MFIFVKILLHNNINNFKTTLFLFKFSTKNNLHIYACLSHSIQSQFKLFLPSQHTDNPIKTAKLISLQSNQLLRTIVPLPETEPKEQCRLPTLIGLIIGPFNGRVPFQK